MQRLGEPDDDVVSSACCRDGKGTDSSRRIAIDELLGRKREALPHPLLIGGMDVCWVAEIDRADERRARVALNRGALLVDQRRPAAFDGLGRRLAPAREPNDEERQLRIAELLAP